MTQKCWSLEKTPVWARIQNTCVKVSNNMSFNAKELWEMETHQEFCLMMRKPGADTVGLDCDVGNELK